MWELFVSPVRRRVFTVTYLLCEDSEVAWRWNFAVSTHLIIKKLIICESSLYKVFRHSFGFLLYLMPYLYNILDIRHRLFNYRHHFLYYFLNSLFLTSFMSYVTSNFCVRMNCAFPILVYWSQQHQYLYVSNILCTAICITMLLTSILVKKRVTYLILYGSPAFSQSFLTLIHGREFCKKPFRFFFFVFSFLFLVCVGVQRNFQVVCEGRRLIWCVWAVRHWEWFVYTLVIWPQAWLGSCNWYQLIIILFIVF